jgi:hypothetical protein
MDKLIHDAMEASRFTMDGIKAQLTSPKQDEVKLIPFNIVH